MKTSTRLGSLCAVLLLTLAWLSLDPAGTPALAQDAAQSPATSPAVEPRAADVSPPPDLTPTYTDAGFHAAEAGLSPSARAGREIWFKATAGNARFHTYTFQQRITALIDWYRRAARRPPRRPLQDLGADQRPRLLHARLGRLPGPKLRGDLRLRLVPGRRPVARASSASRAIATRPATFTDARGRRHRSRRPPHRPRGQLQPGLRHLHRRARLSQVPQPALRCRGLEKAQRQPGHLGGLQPPPVGRSRPQPTTACASWPTARSSRRF